MTHAKFQLDWTSKGRQKDMGERKKFCDKKVVKNTFFILFLDPMRIDMPSMFSNKTGMKYIFPYGIYWKIAGKHRK